MKTNTLALLLTHLTAVMAQVSITTPLTEQRLQRGTKDLDTSLTTSPYQLFKSSTLFRPVSRTARSFTDDMVADQSVGGSLCKQYQLEDVFITDIDVSETAAADKEEIILLAKELSVSLFLAF